MIGTKILEGGKIDWILSLCVGTREEVESWHCFLGTICRIKNYKRVMFYDGKRKANRA